MIPHTLRLAASALGIGALISTGVLRAQSCDCDISDRFEASYDALLDLNAAERARAMRLHLPWGAPTDTPSATRERTLIGDDFVLSHDGDLRCPLWGAFRLDAFDIDHDRKRTECFRPDPRLPEGESATCADYKGSGFNRGHIVPSDSVGRTEASMVNTYVFSNMAPMEGSFNSGIWSHLEKRTRSWAEDHGPIWITVGSVFDRDNDAERDDDNDALRLDGNLPGRVAIPSHFYLIAARQQTDGDLETIAFLLPHPAPGVPSGSRNKDNWLIDEVAVSVREIEEVTGHDFFPDRDRSEQDVFENTVPTELW